MTAPCPEQRRSRSVRAVDAANAVRRGFTLVEFVVAMVLFGIAMSGLFPLVVMHSRVLQSLERRDAMERVGSDVPVVFKWYLVPFSDRDSQGADAWARKLGAGALVKYTAPSSQAIADPARGSTIELDAIDGAAYYSESTTDWSNEATSAAFGGSQRCHPAGNPTSATWTFIVGVAGWYQIQATGLEALGTLPAGCSYALSCNGTSQGIISPTGFTFGAGQSWRLLASRYLNAGDVTVTLTTDGTTAAIADGMRLVPCSLQVKSFTPPSSASATAVVEIKPITLQP